MSSMWFPVEPAVGSQSPRQAARVLSQLPTDLCGDEWAQQASATAGGERWIMAGDTVRQRAAPCGSSPRTLHRISVHWGHQSLPVASELSAARPVLLDGTVWDRRHGVLAVMAAARFAVVDAAPELAAGPARVQPFCTTLAHYG